MVQKKGRLNQVLLCTLLKEQIQDIALLMAPLKLHSLFLGNGSCLLQGMNLVKINSRNVVPETRLYEQDLRQVIDDVEIVLPLELNMPSAPSYAVAKYKTQVKFTGDKTTAPDDLFQFRLTDVYKRQGLYGI